jgi:hypothetical protein
MEYPPGTSSPLQLSGWKRIPGSTYACPAQATVRALTDKQVKIETDNDGKMVLRDVPPQSLQHQGRPCDVDDERVPRRRGRG